MKRKAIMPKGRHALCNEGRWAAARLSRLRAVLLQSSSPSQSVQTLLLAL